MQVLERNKNEIEARAGKMSDFLKMEYLESCIKKFTDIEISRFCYKELSNLYEKKFMYSEALKYITKLKGLSITKREKVECLFKEIELLIISGFPDRADLQFREFSRELNESDRFELKKRITDLYYEEAKKYEKSNKNSALAKIYESLMHYVADSERIAIKRKLFEAYKKLGKIRESMNLEKEISNDNARVRLA